MPSHRTREQGFPAMHVGEAESFRVIDESARLPSVLLAYLSNSFRTRSVPRPSTASFLFSPHPPYAHRRRVPCLAPSYPASSSLKQRRHARSIAGHLPPKPVAPPLSASLHDSVLVPLQALLAGTGTKKAAGLPAPRPGEVHVHAGGGRAGLGPRRAPLRLSLAGPGRVHGK